MKISILTLFPEMFNIFNHSIIGKAKEKALVKIECYKYKRLYIK